MEELSSFNELSTRARVNFLCSGSSSLCDERSGPRAFHRKYTHTRHYFLVVIFSNFSSRPRLTSLLCLRVDVFALAGSIDRSRLLHIATTLSYLDDSVAAVLAYNLYIYIHNAHI